MFYRRKVILALLEVFGNELEKIRLQKLLFLLSRQQSKPDYDFVPYKYGAYSFSVEADLLAMVRKGRLTQTESDFKKSDPASYFKSLIPADQESIAHIKNRYGDIANASLMKDSYINYPFWAIKSPMAKEILEETHYKKVLEAVPVSDETVLFTIGYEGISLEEYLVRLIRHDIKVLVDVRNNPLSRKFGFSKGQLERYSNALDIEYIHCPEVGIQRQERQVLNSQADYDKLFAYYKSAILPQTWETQSQLLNLLKSKKRIALTCFEANICQCHRKYLAEAISGHPGFAYELRHI